MNVLVPFELLGGGWPSMDFLTYTCVLTSSWVTIFLFFGQVASGDLGASLDDRIISLLSNPL
jgi:hypothetical protein